VQVIATWAKRYHDRERVLRTDLGEDIISGPDSTLLLVASLFVSKIVDQWGRDITRDFKDLAGRRLQDLDRPDAPKRDLEVLSVSNDALGGHISSRVHDESSGDLAVSPDLTRGVISTVVDLVARLTDAEWPAPNNSAKLGHDELLVELNDLLFELLDNTFVHGRQRWGSGGHRTLMDQSIRLLRVGVLDSPADIVLKNTEPAGPVSKYLTRSLPAALPGDDRVIRLVEITLLDSGEGLHYWMSNPTSAPTGTPTFDEEVRATSETLLKYRGSRSDLYFRSGLGLIKAVQAISDVLGLVILRTGRLALYRDFAEVPLGKGDGDEGGLFSLDPQVAIFRDQRSKSGRPERMPPVAGTMYSIFVPIFLSKQAR